MFLRPCIAISIAICVSQLFAQPYGLDERVPNTAFLISTPDNIPTTISASGLYEDIAAQKIAAGIIPYSVNSVLWSDGARKQRYIALPGLSQITFSADGFWEFPDDAVFVKNFFVEFERGNPDSERLVETRFLVKRSGVGWDGYSYMWNEDEGEAVLLADSTTVTFTIKDTNAPGGEYKLNYYYPNRFDCLKCHTQAARFALGVRTAQMNKVHDYDGIEDNQLRTLNHIGLFTADIGENYAGFPQLPDPGDESNSDEERARAYLDANCSHCHRIGGTGRTPMDLRFEVPLAETGMIDQEPYLGSLDIQDAKLIKPGSPETSIVYVRMNTRGDDRMPPLATRLTDDSGVDIVGRWIRNLGNASSVRNIGESRTADAFSLTNAYPNPFNPTTTIDFTIKSRTLVRLDIFDILGRQIANLVDETLEPGEHSRPWDAKDKHGRAVSSGVYFYRLTADGRSETRKVVLLR